MFSLRRCVSGLAMDISGKVWVDSALNSGVGGVDATVTLTAGAAPEVYLNAPSTTGTWTVIHTNHLGLCDVDGIDAVRFDASTLTVQAHSSSDDMTYLAWQMVTSLMDLSVPDGRYLQI